MGKTKTHTSSTFKLIGGTLCLLISLTGAAQAQEAKPTPTATPTPAPMPAATPAPGSAVIVITAKYKNTGAVPVARKHFYLSSKPFPSFASLIQKAGPPPSFKEYQREVKQSGKFADETLIAEFIEQWLKKYNCETVYCRPITLDDVNHIRVFAAAHQSALQVFGKRPDGAAEALRWLPNFLPDEIKTRFYDMRAAWLKKALAAVQAEEKVSVKTVMTNRNGLAYFTEMQPGDYYVTNLLPIENADGCFLWTTQKAVKVKTRTDLGFSDKKKGKEDPDPNLVSAKSLGEASADYSCQK